MRPGLVPLIVAGAMLVPPSARCECPREARSVTEIGYWKEDPLQLDATASTLELHSRDYGKASSYARFLVRRGSRNSDDWILHFRDLAYRPLVSMGPADFGDESVLWTGRVPGADFLLDFVGGASGDSVTIEVFVLMPKDAGGKIQHSIQGRVAKYTDLYKESKASLLRLGDSVAFVVNGFKKISWCCSAVFLSQDLVLSNWHCGAPSMTYDDDAFWNKEICQSTLVDLTWHSSPQGRGGRQRVPREYTCFQKEAWNKELDYVLFRVKPTIGRGSGQGAIEGARLARQRAKGHDQLRLVHHPECKVKQLTNNRECVVEDADRDSWVGERKKTEFTHKCDSEMGSSGGPLFNQAGELVGLHHLGFEVVDSETCKTDKLNKAVHIEEILKHIACNNPAVADELGIPRCPGLQR